MNEYHASHLLEIIWVVNYFYFLDVLVFTEFKTLFNKP